MKKKLFTGLKTKVNNLNIAILLRIVIVTNLLDAYLTLKWIHLGIATEANPIMNYLLSFGDLWFVLGKMSFISVACFILWKLRYLKAAKSVALGACILYSVIILLHIVGGVDSGVFLP